MSCLLCWLFPNTGGSVMDYSDPMRQTQRHAWTVLTHTALVWLVLGQKISMVNKIKTWSSEIPPKVPQLITECRQKASPVRNLCAGVQTEKLLNRFLRSWAHWEANQKSPIWNMDASFCKGWSTLEPCGLTRAKQRSALTSAPLFTGGYCRQAVDQFAFRWRTFQLGVASLLCVWSMII